MRRFARDLALRQLIFHRVRKALARVRAARHAHRLIDVRPPRKRVADRPAEAGRRAAERLDLRRVVMRFILEHDEVIAFPIVGLYLMSDRAGVDLLGFVHIRKLSRALRFLYIDCRKVHQAHVLFAA